MSNTENNIFGQVPLPYYTKTEVDTFLLEKANLTADNKLVETEVPDLAICNVFSGDVAYRDQLVTEGTIETGDVYIDTTTGVTHMYTGAHWITIENASFASINDGTIGQTAYSSTKIESDFFKKTDLVDQFSTDSSKGYNVIYLNNELDGKLDKDVLNSSNTGTSLFSLSGNQLSIKRITGSAVTSDSNGLITVNQNDQINDVSISSNKTFSSNKTELIYLKIANLINSGNSSSTVSTYTANRINELINGNVTGVSNANAGGIPLHSGTSGNSIVLKTITGPNVNETNGLITVGQNDQINIITESLDKAYSSQTSNSRFILVSNKVGQNSTDTAQVYNVVYVNSQLDSKLSKNVTDNCDSSANPIFTLNNDILSLRRIKGTAVSLANNTFTINKLTTPEVRSMVIADINGTAHSDRTYSSIYLNNNFFLKADLSNVHSTLTTKSYSANYINTQLTNRLSTSVSNKSSDSGHEIFEVDNQNLKLWKLNAGSNVNIVDSTPNAGVLTISSTDSVPTSGSVVGNSIQVNNSNGTNFSIDVSSLQTDIHLSSGSIVGTNLRLFYDTYDVNTNPNDYFDVDITSLQNSGGSGSSSGSAIYAYSITSANKTQLNYSGLNLTSDSTDYYNYTFAQAVSNANYGISCQHEGLSTDTDTNSFIENKSVNGFQLFFAQGDNGTLTDSPIIRCDHSVQIYGLGAGGSGANTYVNSGSIVGNNIRLVLSDNSTVDVDITSLQSANTTVVSNHTDACSISNNNELNFPNLQLSRSGNNTFVGKNANIYSSSTDCVFVGQDSGYNCSGTLGSTNRAIFIGKQAGQQAWGSDDCIYIGFKTGYDRRNSSTIAIGTEAGRAASYGTATEGEYRNIYIGRECGRSHTGSSDCIFLGYKVGMNDSSGVDGQLRMGASNSKELIYGVMNNLHSNSQFWVNADTVCLGSSLPGNQPSESRQIWRTSTGHLAQGAVSSISNGQKGEPGNPGSKGEPGTGSKGAKGEIGAGVKGEPGIGQKGSAGDKGEPGDIGQKGEKGEIGIGLNGLTGAKGQKGEMGNDGSKGIQGIGIKGEPGESITGQKGEVGQKGETGTGSPGEKGMPGEAASKGDKGDGGLKGQKGVPGTTGNIYWEGGKGEKGDAANNEYLLATNQNTAEITLIKNGSNISTGKLLPNTSGNTYKILRLNSSNNLEWTNHIGTNNNYFNFHYQDTALHMVNNFADLENERAGLISMNGNLGQPFAVIEGFCKSNTNNAKKGYMTFRTPNGSDNNTHEVLRLGQAVFDSDCTAEFYNGRVKIPEVKFSDGQVQENAVKTPLSSDNNYVLKANSIGSWSWQPESTIIDDNNISSNKAWSSGEIHHNIVKGSFQNFSINNNQITFNRYNDNDIVETLPPTQVSTNDADYITIRNNNEIDINTQNISINPVRFGKNNRNITDQATIMIGQNIGKNMTSSKVNNLAIGYNAMKLDDQFYNQNWESIGDNNLGIGHNCMSNVKGGTNFKYNTMLGSYSSFGLENENFANNVGVGYGSFNYIVGVGNTSNSINNNVAVGYYAGAGSKFSDCTYIGCEVGQSNNASNNGYDKRIMIGNKHHTLLDAKCENNSNSTFKINAGHIEIDTDNLPTAYNSNFPKRIWSDLGILRVGPIHDGSGSDPNNQLQNYTGSSSTTTSTFADTTQNLL